MSLINSREDRMAYEVLTLIDALAHTPYDPGWDNDVDAWESRIFVFKHPDGDVYAEYIEWIEPETGERNTEEPVFYCGIGSAFVSTNRYAELEDFIMNNHWRMESVDK